MCDINLILKYKPLSEEILKRRKKCCANKCLNCPYYPIHSGSKRLIEDLKSEFCSVPCTHKVIENGDCECYNHL